MPLPLWTRCTASGQVGRPRCGRRELRSLWVACLTRPASESARSGMLQCASPGCKRMRSARQHC
eukprot:6060401-Alexandrium_andersonii.AAC.1